MSALFYYKHKKKSFLFEQSNYIIIGVISQGFFENFFIFCNHGKIAVFAVRILQFIQHNGLYLLFLFSSLLNFSSAVYGNQQNKYCRKNGKRNYFSTHYSKPFRPQTAFKIIILSARAKKRTFMNFKCRKHVFLLFL